MLKIIDQNNSGGSGRRGHLKKEYVYKIYRGLVVMLHTALLTLGSMVVGFVVLIGGDLDDLMGVIWRISSSYQTKSEAGQLKFGSTIGIVFLIVWALFIFACWSSKNVKVKANE